MRTRPGDPVITPFLDPVTETFSYVISDTASKDAIIHVP